MLEKFRYLDGKNYKTLRVKHVSLWSPGLLFRRKCSPLLFTLPSFQKFSITSLFCPVFYAIVLDEELRVIDKVLVRRWRLSIPLKGKYLLEIVAPKIPRK